LDDFLALTYARMRQAGASRDVNGLKWGEAEKALQQDVLTCEVLSPLFASAFPWPTFGFARASSSRWIAQAIASSSTPALSLVLLSLVRARNPHSTR